jgi:hypothetical protein
MGSAIVPTRFARLSHPSRPWVANVEHRRDMDDAPLGREEFVSAMEDAAGGIEPLCCTVPCSHPTPSCRMRAAKARPDIRRLVWDLIQAGMRRPSLIAQFRLAEHLEELARATSLPAALSDDGEGGLFAEWIADDQRLTVEVDRLGEAEYYRFEPETGSVLMTLDVFARRLEELDERVVQARASR